MFYVIEVSTGDAAIAGKAVYQYETQEEAVGTFHSKLGAAMKSDKFTTELCMVIDDNGAVYRSEKYTKAVQPVEEEPVEEPIEEEPIETEGE